MRKLFVALTTAGVTTAFLAVPPGGAHAADCVPSEDFSFTQTAMTPTTLAIGIQLAKTVDVSASTTVGCSGVRVRTTVGDTDQGPGSNLVSSDEVGSWSGTITVTPADLDNSMAGTAETTFQAYQVDDEDQVIIRREINRDLHLYRAARLTVNASPEPANPGGTLTVTGTLQRANWDEGVYQGYPNRTVQLMFRAKGGSYAAVKSVTSGPGGRLQTTVTANQDGYYVWDYAGNSTTAAIRPAGDYIDVR